LALVVVVVVLLDALPFESAAELVVVVSVLTFLPWSLVSVLVVVVESVVDCSALWPNMAVAVKSATKIDFFMKVLNISGQNESRILALYLKRPPRGLRYMNFDVDSQTGRSAPPRSQG